MNNQAKAILWMGLILVATQIGALWPSVRKYLFSPGPGTGGVGGSGGLVPLPGFPSNPFYPGWPFVTSIQVPAGRKAKG